MQNAYSNFYNSIRSLAVEISRRALQMKMHFISFIEIAYGELLDHSYFTSIYLSDQCACKNMNEDVFICRSKTHFWKFCKFMAALMEKIM